MRARFSYSLACLGLLLSGSSLLAADLTADSPFMPANGSAAPAAITEGGAIELHGIMTTSQGTAFSIYDTQKKSSQWVRVNQTGSAFVVRSHNLVDGNDEVKVDYQGSSLTLALKTPKIAQMSRANPMAITGIPGGPLNRSAASPITQTVMVNPTPADEAARLQAVVDAVAARRAARNQATQTANGAAPDAPTFPAATQTPRQNGTGATTNGQRAKGTRSGR